MTNPAAVGLGIILILIDQVTKRLALNHFPVHFNRGVAFGIGASIPIWIVIITLLLLVIIISKREIQISDILIISGGMSNIIDRVMFGSVIDWMPFLKIWINLADTYITLGVIWTLRFFIKTRNYSL